ncbi:Lipoyl synthase chloroplastic [Bienertia sinuspersici]
MSQMIPPMSSPLPNHAIPKLNYINLFYSLPKIRCQISPMASSASSMVTNSGELLNTKPKQHVVPYPGGLGPHTGRDPNVKKPEWLRQKAPQGKKFEEVKESLSHLNLHTVCEEAQCPNIGECWNGGGDGIATATIMVLGDTCTRGCRFCAVKTSKTLHCLIQWNLRIQPRLLQVGGVDYIVLTSVDRDDLPDGGSGHFAQTVKAMKKLKPEIMIECLTSDFRGDLKAVDTLVHSGLDVFAHNIETVKRLQRIVRDPRQELVCTKTRKLSKGGMITKTSIMLGLGETDDELKEAMADLRAIEVDILTLGQIYSQHHCTSQLKSMLLREFCFLEGVRSSYRAGELFVQSMVKGRDEAPLSSSL